MAETCSGCIINAYYTCLHSILLVSVANKDLVFREQIVVFYRGHDPEIHAPAIPSLDTSETLNFIVSGESSRSVCNTPEH